jgi:SAM-dependent methyltransferase
MSIDFRRTTPYSRVYGFDRGTPIDRRYIEGFLERHAADVRGRVLEIKDDTYTRRFGGSRIDPANPRATIVDDLTTGDRLESGAYDCVILTQTLQLIFDVQAAIRTVHRILAPGGVVLVTVPGITHVPRADAESWYWSFTALAMRRLFVPPFKDDAVSVSSHGNVLAAAAFLYGLALHELREDELRVNDPEYPLTVTVRAVKEGAS